MKRNTINNKIANVTLALLVSTAYVTGAMESDDQQAEGKYRSNWMRGYEYTAEDLEDLKEAAKVKAQIHAEVGRALLNFENNMNIYYERTGNPKRISMTLPWKDVQEKQHEQSTDEARDYWERWLQETEVIYKLALKENKRVLKHYPVAETRGAGTAIIPKTMEQEITPKSEAQAKAEIKETKVEALDNDQQRQSEKIGKQTVQEKLEAEKAKVELRKQEQLRKAEEARRQLAQRKAEAEAARTEMLNKSQQGQSAQGQTAQERLEAEKAKAELRRQEQLRKAEEARRQLAQRKAEAEAAKAGMRKQEHQYKADNVQEQEEQ